MRGLSIRAGRRGAKFLPPLKTKPSAAKIGLATPTARRFIRVFIAICPRPNAKKLMWEGGAFCWRLDMAKALALIDTPLTYTEHGAGHAETLPLDPAAFGDVVLARKDVPTSYHLAVVVDDAAQGVTQVTRGQDLKAATAVHAVLQKLLDLPQPDYLHHALVRDTSGRRLSKQAGDNGFRELRQQGMRLEEVLALLPPPFGDN
jgi:glutamyl-Q tRNA(Asp) synthetase